MIMYLLLNDTQSKYFSERFYVDSFINGDYYSEYFSTEKRDYEIYSKDTRKERNQQRRIGELEKRT